MQGGEDEFGGGHFGDVRLEEGAPWRNADALGEVSMDSDRDWMIDDIFDGSSLRYRTRH